MIKVGLNINMKQNFIVHLFRTNIKDIRDDKSRI
jgi:hypothetical protein